LIKHGYVQRDQLDIILVKLTEKGNAEIERLENKTKIKDSQVKIQGMLTSFKESHLSRSPEEKSEKKMRQIIETKYEHQLILLIDSREIKDKQ
jgi:DNA-binding MarR family transcriptional regulator